MCPPDLLRDRVRDQSLDEPRAAKRSGAGRAAMGRRCKRMLEEAGAEISLHAAGAGPARPGVHGQRGADLSRAGHAGPLSPSASGRAKSRTTRPGSTAHGFTVEQLPAGHYFEGAGDALFCGDTLFAGYRIRSDARGHQQIGEMLGCRVIPLELVDPYYYHLDTCFCPLAPGQAIYYPGGVRRNTAATCSSELVPRLDRGRATKRPGVSPATPWWSGRTVVTNTGCPQLHARSASRGLSTARDAARRVRQSRRQRQVPDLAAGRRRGRRVAHGAIG